MSDRWIEETFHADWRVALRASKVLHEVKTDHQPLVIFDNPTWGKVLMLEGDQNGVENLYQNRPLLDEDQYFDEASRRAFEALRTRYSAVASDIGASVEANRDALWRLLGQGRVYVYLAGYREVADALDEAMNTHLRLAGRWDDAKAVAAKLQQPFPDNPTGYELEAAAYRGTGNISKALDALGSQLREREAGSESATVVTSVASTPSSPRPSPHNLPYQSTPFIGR